MRRQVFGLARLLLPPSRGRRYWGVAMLGSYGDDSRTRHTIAVALCLSTADQWDRFAEDWHASVLKRFGLNSFHTEAFVGRKGEYNGWKIEEYRDLFRRVLSVIGRRTQARLGTVVNPSAYNQLMRRLREKEKKWPYGPI